MTPPQLTPEEQKRLEKRLTLLGPDIVGLAAQHGRIGAPRCRHG